MKTSKTSTNIGLYMIGIAIGGVAAMATAASVTYDARDPSEVVGYPVEDLHKLSKCKVKVLDTQYVILQCPTMIMWQAKCKDNSKECSVQFL